MTARNKAISYLTVTALVAALAATPIVAAAQPPDPEYGFGERHGRHERGQERLVEYLELDEQQQSEWEALMEVRDSMARDVFAQQRDLHDQIEEQLASGNPDPASIGALVIEAHANREGLRAQRDDLEERFVALLHPDQIERWEAMKALRGSDDERQRRQGRRMKGRGSRLGQ